MYNVDVIIFYCKLCDICIYNVFNKFVFPCSSVELHISNRILEIHYYYNLVCMQFFYTWQSQIVLYPPYCMLYMYMSIIVYVYLYA